MIIKHINGNRDEYELVAGNEKHTGLRFSEKTVKYGVSVDVKPNDDPRGFGIRRFDFTINTVDNEVDPMDAIADPNPPKRGASQPSIKGVFGFDYDGGCGFNELEVLSPSGIDVLDKGYKLMKDLLPDVIHHQPAHQHREDLIRKKHAIIDHDRARVRKINEALK